MRRKYDHRGHTLLELLMVLAVLTLAQAWLVPAAADLLHSVRLHNGAQALAESLARARSEAIARNSRVVVCKSANGASCESGVGWEAGWIVFHDPNNNATVDPGEALLHREHALPAALRLTGNTPVSEYVSYTSFGRTMLVSGAFQAGTFTLCGKARNGSLARQVIINSAGRARMDKITVARCE